MSLLLPGLAQVMVINRRQMCMQNLKVLGQASHLYGNDYYNRIPTFSWRADLPPNPTPGSPVTGSIPSDDVAAAHLQARDIIWSRTSPHWDIGDQGAWFPHFGYSTLVLLDYMGYPMLGTRQVCPEDQNLPRWQTEFQRFVTNNPLPTLPTPSGAMGRWPFMSNYTMTTACWGADGGSDAVTLAQSHQYWIAPNSASGVLGRRRIDQVQFPSQKVYMYDSHARHMGGRSYFYAWSNARQPLLFFDGSIRDKRTGDGNRGFSPRNPTSLGWFVLSYSPEPPPHNWESPSLNGGWGVDSFSGAYYRFTRSGLRGRDFDGPEVPW